MNKWEGKVPPWNELKAKRINSDYLKSKTMNNFSKNWRYKWENSNNNSEELNSYHLKQKHKNNDNYTNSNSISNKSKTNIKYIKNQLKALSEL
jgi:hypothetical protein